MHVAGNATDQEIYGRMSSALNATNRPITFSLCQWGGQHVYEWGGDVAQMYRVQMDHLPLWYGPKTAAGAGVGQGTRQIIEYMAQLVPSKWTQRFGWMDPDFLMTLYWPTMDFVASRTEYTFWSLWSAPLLVATDVRSLSDEKRKILLNHEVIAINQDESATAGDRLRSEGSGAEVWARDLQGGDKAVVLFNGQRTAIGPLLNVSCTWRELGWPEDARVSIRDLWAGADLGVFISSFTAVAVPPRDVRFLRLTPV